MIARVDQGKESYEKIVWVLGPAGETKRRNEFVRWGTDRAAGDAVVLKLGVADICGTARYKETWLPKGR